MNNNPLIDLLNRLMNAGVPQDSQVNMKNALKNQFMAQSKSPQATALLNGLYVLFGKRYDFENQLRILESLTSEDIRKALEYFNPAKSGISIRGIR
jgi:predicted Zn-dependent peptidase